MTTHATGSFEVNSWDEKPLGDIDGESKLTRATVTQIFHGDIEGTGTVEYLMAYPSDEFATFVGMQRIVGRVGEHAGSFVLQLSGTFEHGEAKGLWFVVPGSGTGNLRGLRGDGGFAAPTGTTAEITLDYELR